jgi:hypothetical protein
MYILTHSICKKIVLITEVLFDYNLMAVLDTTLLDPCQQLIPVSRDHCICKEDFRLWSPKKILERKK